MIPKFFLFAIVALCGFSPTVLGDDDCVAGSVANLRIHADATLSWSIDASEPCPVQLFKIDIIGNRGDEYHFRTTESSVDLSFLEICEEWHFVVIPISNGVEGYSRRLVDYIPLPPNADISINNFVVTPILPRDAILQWSLFNETHGDCTLRYRISVENDVTGSMDDVYVSQKTLRIRELSPCVRYEFGVRAVNRAHPIIEGPKRYIFYDVAAQPEYAPTLNSISIGVTEVNMTWRTENPGRNLCPLRNLRVYGGNYFDIVVPIEDTQDREPIEVNLRGLRENTMYYMEVSVENSGGYSRHAPIAVQTLPFSPGIE